MEEWNPAAEVAKSTREGREGRNLAICGLVGLAICYVALKVIDWNDCARYAASIGIPTTFTLDEGCLVLSTGGAYSADRYDDYTRNHPYLATGFVLLGIWSLVVSVRFAPRVATDFINGKRVAKHIAKGFHHFEPSVYLIFFIREAQNNQHHRKVYQLRTACTELITIEGGWDNAYLPIEEFDTIEDARARMELIAPVGKWIPNG